MGMDEVRELFEDNSSDDLDDLFGSDSGDETFTGSFDKQLGDTTISVELEGPMEEVTKITSALKKLLDKLNKKL